MHDYLSAKPFYVVDLFPKLHRDSLGCWVCVIFTIVPASDQVNGIKPKGEVNKINQMQMHRLALHASFIFFLLIFLDKHRSFS